MVVCLFMGALCVAMFFGIDCRPTIDYCAAAQVEEIDTTRFNLRYGNKIWTFDAQDFEIDANIFTDVARASAFGRNGTRENKIKLMNKLIEINIDYKVAFNYIYNGFDVKINKIKKNIEKLPQNAEISIKGGSINVKGEVVGVKVDECLLYEKLIDLYANNNVINL